jgi:UDP-N-acetyl-D-glucosamine dehydrogenase
MTSVSTEIRSRPDPGGELLARIEAGQAKIGVIGMGYVGLPLIRLFCEKGFGCVGFELDAAKVDRLNAGQSYIHHIEAAGIAALVASGRFSATMDFDRLREMDAIIICVPTPLTAGREPDMSYIVATGRAIASRLHAGQLVVLESTTYPGTTDDVLRPILEAGGLRSGVDFFLGYSPEREDPGNAQFATAGIPKVVGGDGDAAKAIIIKLYDRIVVRTVPVSNMRTAEAVKLTENIFRAVNIALVNELKVIYSAMGIDIWEVIEAAKSKPFGYMPFHPGPGLGGHCIPIDPFYLTWKARQHGISTRFIELAGEINTAMPQYVVGRLIEALEHRFGLAPAGASILIIGIAYKKNVDDMRESPALHIFEMLEGRGAKVAFHDPYIPEIRPSREHASLTGRKSVALDTLGAFDAVLILTDHDGLDYAAIGAQAKLVVDTRNALARAGYAGPNVVAA